MANITMSGEKNVHSNLSVISTNIRKALLVFFLLSVFLELQATEECDFVKCVTSVRSYLIDLNLNKKSFTCKNLFDIKWCSEQCVQKFFSNAFSLSKEGQLSFTKFCEGNISSRINVNWSCITQHTYRLFTCLVNVNSLTANSVREDMPTESCRKYLELPNCAKQVLQADCGKESSDVIKDLILFILDNYQPDSCRGANVKEVLLMPISYQLGSDFVDAAKSLDDHKRTVHTCLTQYIQDESDLEGFMCGEYEPDIAACVNYALAKNEKPHPDVKRLLLKMIALSGFKCKQSNVELKTISSSHSTESDKFKINHYHSLKDGTISDSLEISTSKNINNDLKSTSEFPTHAKTEVEEMSSKDSVRDLSAVNKNIKNINVNQSVNKNSKRHMDQNVHISNASSRISSIHICVFFLIFVLFTFR